MTAAAGRIPSCVAIWRKDDTLDGCGSYRGRRGSRPGFPRLRCFAAAVALGGGSAEVFRTPAGPERTPSPLIPQTPYRFLAPLRLAARLAFIGLDGVFGFGFVGFGFAGSFGSAIPLLQD